MFRLSTIPITLAAVLVAGAAQAGSAHIAVPASATGGFGSPNAGFTKMTKALTVTKAGVVTIAVASGSFCYKTACPGPDGRPDAGITGSWFPLQQATGDYGGAKNGLALMAAFVPQEWTIKAGFNSVDQRLMPNGYGIGADKLFMVGKRTFFVAPGPGTIYLGNNDYNPKNDTGSIVVDLTGP